ncbi:MAG: hypothetical protein GY820_03135 [Gammaproteobacteria bacterium]|nr:hypothetical protein [Gammaproteobacteria bacterium]
MPNVCILNPLLLQWSNKNAIDSVELSSSGRGRTDRPHRPTEGRRLWRPHVTIDRKRNVTCTNVIEITQFAYHSVRLDEAILKMSSSGIFETPVLRKIRKGRKNQ